MLYRATRTFNIGTLPHSITVGMGSTLEFDGQAVVYREREFEFPQLRSAVEAGWLEMAASTIKCFPHCDSRVLHKPGDCEHCDKHPDWQELRDTWKINFTGERDPNKALCPSEVDRSVDDIHAWSGNRPTRVSNGPRNLYDHLRDE